MFTKRQFLTTTALGGLALGTGLAMPAISRAQSRPVITHGLQSGDVAADSAMIWARADRPARMFVEVATSESFTNPMKLAPLDALPESDFAVKRLLAGLSADQDIFYRVSLADLAEINVMSEPMTVPMIVFILPTLFIVIIAPAALGIMDSMK